jgi:STAM-binding protein
MWGEWDKELRRESSEGDDLSSQIQEVARMQNGHYQAPNFSVRVRISLPNSADLRQRPTSIYNNTSTYHYPSVPQKGTQEGWSGSHSIGAVPARPPKEQLRRPSDTGPRPPALPPKPPKPQTSGSQYDRPQPPPIPGKYNDPPLSAPPLPGKYLDSSTPTPRAASPQPDFDEFSFKPSAYLENGEPLRTVFLPSQLRHSFLRAASRNTSSNLETCGILCGILKSNALFITRLVIPEQVSTSDTCETVNEQELFDYCDKEELMVLGWIHTHPSQTCFMSSRDLHTHVGYQVMMPESIAIVCAPSKEPRYARIYS